MSLSGACSRRGGGRFQLPRRRRPPVVDVGCNCRTPRLLSSLISSLKSHARGVVGGGNFKSPHPSSSRSSLTTTAFTSSTTTMATSASSVDHSSWGPATYSVASTLYEDEAEARRQRQRRRRRRRYEREQARREETAVAVEVESSAPYEDFRESMVAMVTEKEMYAWEDLNELLHQFLALNSPRHHPLILTAFADLWAPRGGLFCPPSPCLL
ncbi:transcription repressor OFP8-like [Phragmites australis]|uniref:transcription repressor OFP8-like n=1 Tax=Phragmites australis TaxID=29695 RepID=UPI002D766163|nr:transcription repressor OFP8-like [Phragmites australis]